MEPSYSKNQTESYYSSDDDIAWGRVTAREVKGSLKIKSKKVDRRHTTCILRSEDNTFLSKDSEGKTKTMPYTTAMESLVNSKGNGDFLSQLNDVISSVSKCDMSTNETKNLVNSVTTVSNNDTYYTTIDKELEKVDLDTSSEVYEADISCMSPVIQTNNLVSSVYTYNDTYCTSEDNELQRIDLKSAVNDLNESQNKTQDGSEDNLIMIDLSQFDDSPTNSFVSEKSLCVVDISPLVNGSKIQYNDENNTREEYVIDSSDKFTTTHISEQNCPANNLKIDSIEASNEYSQEYWSSRSDSGSKIIDKEYPEELDVKKTSLLDKSNDSSDYGEYNDTLDEIDRLLQNDDNQNSPIFKKNSLGNFSFDAGLGVTPINIISGSFLSADKNIEKLQSISNKMGSSSTKSEIPVKTLFSRSGKKDDNFKIPKPMKTQPLNFKNVISPVAVYINNTPSPCLKRNVNAKSNTTNFMPSKLFDKPVETNNTSAKKTENTCFKSKIPEVIYKPAKSNKTSYEETVNLPNNIKKHISEKKLIVHNNRIKNVDLSETYISRKLMEGDLTNASINISNMTSENLNQDISVITEKQVIIQQRPA